MVKAGVQMEMMRKISNGTVSRVKLGEGNNADHMFVVSITT